MLPAHGHPNLSWSAMARNKLSSSSSRSVGKSRNVCSLQMTCQPKLERPIGYHSHARNTYTCRT